MDLYYRRQWEAYLQTGILATQGGLVTAFSQDGPSKVYVTHQVRQHAQQLYDLLTQVLSCHIVALSVLGLCPSW